ncbi:TetR/AcrR family transcriptional regulator [Actinotalea fermentans]|uniref:TetR family transcriptional regulator n=1 Tax=Actinotalea fermentans TaxID=43671 RepID=A0A511Z1K5_9CELL|nr:TetR/AcrR family transcriptional regulator [Actinotalea fermentans]KGM15274.1 hypothetical protein N867_10240 [Actinotalea fermentans ATCC 43279 = JCM 9966 = DSM 3133]GEN81335.1 TetR family transcriptional regulator [Actinotalea fermentans]
MAARGSGDPARLVGLLWAASGSGAAPGRTGLSTARVVDVAVTLADEEGLAAVTMRRVADALGVGAMSLYTYVPGRAELVELMLDRVAAQVYDGGDLPRDVREAAGWRAGVLRVVDANWAHHLRHPWTIDVPPARPVLGPGVTSKYELELAPLDGIGLSDLEIEHVLSSVLGLVGHAARWTIGVERVRAETALTELEWWETVGPALGAAMGGRSFPLAERVGSAVGEAVQAADDPELSMRYGVERLLDGVAARLR